MKPECIKKVQEHLSKVRGAPVTLTKAEIDAIDKRMRQSARDVFVRDPNAFRGMTAEERTLAAGIEAASAGERAADAKAIGAMWQTKKRVDRLNEVKTTAQTPATEGGTAGAKEKYPHIKAIMRMMEQTARLKGGAVAGVHAQLSDLWGATANKFRMLPMLDDPKSDEVLLRVFREMRGENSNDATAKTLATGIADLMADMRKRLNQFGANIDQLDNYVPQDHNARLINAAGKDNWVNDTFQMVDHGTYIDDEGNQLAPHEIREILGEMWETITTDGRAKKEFNEAAAQIEGPLGGRSVMERAASFSRQIHFKDAAAHEAYHAKYSELKPAGLLLQNLQRTAEDLAVVERFGPDAKQNIAKLIDVAHRLDDEYADTKGFSKEAGKRTIAGVNPQQLSEALLGHDDDFKSAVVDAARWFTSMHTATKLTRTAIRAVPQDLNTIVNYSMELGHLSKLPQLLKASTDKQSRETLRRMGIGAGIIEQSLMATGRRVQGIGWAGQAGMDRFANATMHLTGLQQWTNSAARSGQLIHGMHLADMVGKDWASLKQGTQQLFSEVGISAENWDLVRQVPTTKVAGVNVPDVSQIASALPHLSAQEHNDMTRLVNAFVWEGGNKITNEKDLLARTAGGFGAKPGTSAQAVIQSLMLFRGVVSVITANMIRRWKRQETLGGKLAITGSYVGGATMAGYVGNSLVNLSDGKNAPDPTDGRSWLAAFSTGGGAGFFGDMIAGGLGQVAESQSGGGSSMWRLAGPTGSEIGDVFNIAGATYKAMTEGSASAGDRAAFQAVRFARNHIPLMNLWYTKSAVDHLFMNDINEAVMPGYKKKMENLAGKYGNQYFWSPSGNLQAPGFGEFKD